MHLHPRWVVLREGLGAKESQIGEHDSNMVLGLGTPQKGQHMENKQEWKASLLRRMEKPDKDSWCC